MDGLLDFHQADDDLGVQILDEMLAVEQLSAQNTLAAVNSPLVDVAVPLAMIISSLISD